jgi:hypothetical protein
VVGVIVDQHNLPSVLPNISDAMYYVIYCADICKC